MSKPQIGQLGGTDLGRRDAFHVPCILATSPQYLESGQLVRFHNSKVVLECVRSISHGIVDPFVAIGIMPGTPFWVMIHPGLTKDLTHHFVVEGLDDTSDSSDKTCDNYETTDVSDESEAIIAEIEDAENYDSECARCYGEEVEEDDGCTGCY